MRVLIELGLTVALVFLLVIGAHWLAPERLDWPFELFAHFTPHLCVAAILLSGALTFWRPLRAGIWTLVFAAPLLFLAIRAPGIEPDRSIDCGATNCLTVITANVWSRRDALEVFAELAIREDAAVIAINEVPRGETVESLSALFPAYETKLFQEPSPSPLTFPSALLIKTGASEPHWQVVPNSGRRTVAAATVDFDGVPIRMVTMHPTTPGSSLGLEARSALYKAATAQISDGQAFVLLGDFNITPWVPAFASLPGQRAGHPLKASTWVTSLPLIGLPIDHILFSEELTLAEFEVMGNIGSDHRPLLARFALPQ